jgi:hypothetical protein
MRCADAVCAQYDRPAGVAFSFQIREYSVEPTVANRTFNLFAKDNPRMALADEPEHFRPEMPLVVRSFSPAGF